MTLTGAEVDAWLARYVEAWKAYEAGAIGDLISEDAEYCYHPWHEPVRGRAAIVADGLASNGDATRRDAPGTY